MAFKISYVKRSDIADLGAVEQRAFPAEVARSGEPDVRRAINALIKDLKDNSVIDSSNDIVVREVRLVP